MGVLMLMILDGSRVYHVEHAIKDYCDESRGLLFYQLESKERSNFFHVDDLMTKPQQYNNLP